MILLQNPSIPVATNAIEIDAAIIDIQSHLDSGLLWLTNGYGRAYKNVDSTQGNTVYYPEVYLGTQNNSQRYTNISPDNDKQGQNFFFVTKETISQFQPGMYSFLTYDTAIIFSVNLELINSALLGTEIYQQILVAQVRDVLTRQLLGSSYQLKINSVDLLFDNVFSEFDLKDAAQLEKAPLSHFRFNCSITLPEACPVPSLGVCLIGSTYSTPFDGVNSYIITKDALSVYDLEGNQKFSFSFYIKPDVMQDGDVINKFTAASPTVASGYFVRMTAAGNIRVVLMADNISDKIDISSVGTVSSGVWSHVVVTNDGSQTAAGIKIYINKVVQTTTIAFDGLSSPINNAGEILKIGANTGNSRYFSGLIDDVKIWNIELTADQSSCPTSFAATSLVFYNKMGEGSLFGFSNRHYPDETGLSTGYSSQNMSVADISTDTIN
jgi:hypothetical protein